MAEKCHACSGACARCGRDFNVQDELREALEALIDASEGLYKSGRLDAGAWLLARQALARAGEAA